MTRTVLVPFDGSPLSSEALRHALTTFPDATITVLYVVDLFEPDVPDGADIDSTYEPLMGSEAWYEWTETITAHLFERARDLAEEYDRTVETESDIGDPKRIVVDHAAEESVDHVVIGAHGRPAEREAPLGSVATVVARRSNVPVTLVR
ncbi:MAG: universal stress protein [Haloplanus sp.]